MLVDWYFNPTCNTSILNPLTPKRNESKREGRGVSSQIYAIRPHPTEDYLDNEDAKLCALIAVDEIIKSLDDVLHPNPFGQYWNKVKQEMKTFMLNCTRCLTHLTPKRNERQRIRTIP